MDKNKRFPLKINRGESFAVLLTISNTDLSDCSSEMQIRSSYSSNTVTESLSTSNGEIVVNTSAGTMYLELSPERTSNIYVNLKDSNIPPQKTYYYDLKFTNSDNDVEYLLWGPITVYGEVTR